MVAYVNALIGLIGLVIYLAATSPKIVRIGEILLFCGLLALCIHFGVSTKRLF